MRARRDNSGYSQDESGPSIRYNIVRTVQEPMAEQNASLLKRLALYAAKSDESSAFV